MRKGEWMQTTAIEGIQEVIRRRKRRDEPHKKHHLDAVDQKTTLHLQKMQTPAKNPWLGLFH